MVSNEMFCNFMVNNGAVKHIFEAWNKSVELGYRGGNFKFEAILGPDAVMKRHGHHYEDECQWNMMIEVAYHVPDQEMTQSGDGDAPSTVVTIHDDRLHYITLGQMLIDLLWVAEPELDVLRSLSPEVIPEEKEQQLEKKSYS